MMTQAEFYQIHLDRVSRSFAFCIRQLPPSLREWVGLSYLLCRILDTIEDSAWTDQAKQFAVFALFDEALLQSGKTAALERWAESFPITVSAGERMLLEDAEELFEDLHALPADVQKLICELVHSMSLGMQHFAKQNKAGALHLKNLDEVNQYCFFVAGLVGELLAKLMAKIEPTFALNQKSLARAHHFGLFLQKVNLLKDQAQDQRLGRHLIPSRDLVEKSAGENVRRAFEFLLELPFEQIEFRRFCGWSLFLGLEAVMVAREGKAVKVPRERAEAIVTAVEDALSDPQALNALFNEGIKKLGWEPLKMEPSPAHGSIPEWLFDLYQGLLSRESLAEVLN